MTLSERVRLEHLPNKKAGLAPAIFDPIDAARRPGGARLHPGKETEACYFFFAAFLAFFAFFFTAFFAFLAIVSS